MQRVPVSEPAPGRSDRTKLFTINVVVTGRCNAACTYCHYYLAHDRKRVAFDISDAQFDGYMGFVSAWVDQVEGYTQYRFSGGDPLVLGKRLFSLADRGYDLTGLKPFVLTAGKSLTPRWAEAARKSSISHVFVSVENPFCPDSGAPDPQKVVTAIKECNSTAMPVVPGVCVVPNEMFGRIDEICEWFFDRLGRIPLICEINYDAYVSPTEAQWEDLRESVERTIHKFVGKTHLNLFSSVAPELCYGGHDPYIFELNLENSYGITVGNAKGKIPDVAANLIMKNYPRLHCHKRNCNWWDFCDNTKWYWQGDRNNSATRKLVDYCRLKRLVSDAFYKVLVDARHSPTLDGLHEGRVPGLLQKLAGSPAS